MKLEFSVKWVASFLQRAGLRRRRITAKHKVNRHTVAEVQQRNVEIQECFDAAGFSTAQRASADETAIMYAQAVREIWP